jgi:hypothetical protein
MQTGGNVLMCGSEMRLTVGSTCVDAGTTVDAPPVDIDGQPRDGAPDIGPDELNP